MYKNFSDFYPYYLSQHSNLTTRKLHFIGTCGVVSLLAMFFFTGNMLLLALVPFMGYGFAWIGHFIIEKNTPVSMKHPWWSLLGDFRMFWDILIGKVRAF